LPPYIAAALARKKRLPALAVEDITIVHASREWEAFYRKD